MPAFRRRSTDFAAQGFVLTGGRTDKVAGSLAAVIGLCAMAIIELDLFAWADRGAPLPASGMSRGFRTSFLEERRSGFRRGVRRG